MKKVQEDSNRDHGLSHRTCSLGYTMSYFFPEDIEHSQDLSAGNRSGTW